ncbi:MAG TPA: LLM class flavin-dependent oxidoreductase [Solirubrobacteraceae bacterium]|jgi:alkanesulfonate monooxygenase SsuD/methylene tetrahydromethanopterin reductase-like flavin-dependent oxidoreductase (luciferase family)|nr:LLM class flavin-dependent oxidoreductase [Solirubrobacteraceae bacterium]
MTQDTCMKFGVLQFFSWPRRRVPLEAIFDRAMRRIEIMDDSGYDAVWLAEHHFTGYSVCPSVHMMGTLVANRTTRLRIGTGVSLAAFYHPLRLAEEVALLDLLSGGRVNWGAGRGFDPVEFSLFDVPVEKSGELFHEAVEIVQAAWISPRLDWAGKHWSFEDVEVLPKPVQRPHPPIWLAAGSEGSIKWAGKRGYSILLGPHSTFAENAAHRELYRTELEAGGHSIVDRDVPMARMIAVADSDEQARRIARDGAGWIAGAYINKSKVTRPNAAAQKFMLMERERLLDRYVEEVVIHGTPERVADELERLREEMHLEYLMCVPLSHASFMAFTERVLPRFL